MTSDTTNDPTTTLRELLHEIKHQDKLLNKFNYKEEKYNDKINHYKSQIVTLQQKVAVIEAQVDERRYDKDRDDFDDESESMEVFEVAERKRRKKKKVQNSDDQLLVEESSSTEEIDFGDDNLEKKKSVFDEDILMDIISGIGVTIAQRGQLVEDVDEILLPFDFSYDYQFKIEDKDRKNDLLKFKDFAPKVFAQIRMIFGVSDEDYLNSFTIDNLKAVKGEGKSGAFFVFTKDKQFIVKTATEQERDFLWRMLPDYLKHIKKYPNTLLPRFYGVYSMKHEGIGGVIRFVVMQNVFCYPYQPVEKYDLKGSSVGRYVKAEKKKPGVILKDLDIKGDDRKIWLSKENRAAWAEQLGYDTQFLAEMKVMDYSLLLGCYYETEENKKRIKQQVQAFDQIDVWKNITKSKWMEDHGGIGGYNEEEDREEIYYIGIIDILIKYKAGKKMEHAFKAIAYDADEVSVVHPKKYATRFCDFMVDLLPIDPDEKDELMERIEEHRSNLKSDK